MKKLLIFVFALVATNVSAQYYAGISGGFAMPSATTLMGTELTGTTLTTEYGSFGEGMNFSVHAGYFFNEKFGIELKAGFLNGSDQIRDTYKTGEVTDAIAYARVMRVAPTLVYNISDKVYGKFGAIVPVGGKTVAEFTRTTSAGAAGNIVTVGEQEYKGKFGAGVTGTLGYKYSLGNNLNLFAEVEYIGLSVDRDTSVFTDFKMTLPAALGGTVFTMANLPIVNHPVVGNVPKEYTYVDTLPTTNTDKSKVLGETAAYSSFGINFGITYTFGK